MGNRKKHLDKLNDSQRMMVAIKEINIKPIIDEVHHNPLWIFFALVLFFAVGNLLQILWILSNDLRRLLTKLLGYPKRFVRKGVAKIKLFLSKRYGKKKRGKKSIKSKEKRK